MGKKILDLILSAITGYYAHPTAGCDGFSPLRRGVVHVVRCGNNRNSSRDRSADVATPDCDSAGKRRAFLFHDKSAVSRTKCIEVQFGLPGRVWIVKY